MEATSFLDLVARYRFAKAGKICRSGDRVTFVLSSDGKEHCFVYLWVERSDQQFHIVYVGMAGKTLKARCDQHQNGFTGSPTGRAHHSRLNSGFDAGKQYEIYARRAELGEILGESQIPMVCAEELAFIKKFRPLWNRGA
jgi:hypothetical protein